MVLQGHEVSCRLHDFFNILKDRKIGFFSINSLLNVNHPKIKKLSPILSGNIFTGWR
jgi:hypothetical protein